MILSEKSIHLIGSDSLCEALRNMGADVSFYSPRSTGFDLLARETWSQLDCVLHSDEEIALCIGAGFLQNRPIECQAYRDIQKSFMVNCTSIVLLCEYMLQRCNRVRLVVLGSESGEKGSYDTTYFLAKAALAAYVRERRVAKFQSINMISPSTVEDGGMTLRRNDKGRLAKKQREQPQNRFVRMEEIAATVLFLVSDFGKSICNEEVRVNGGKFARMVKETDVV